MCMANIPIKILHFPDTDTADAQKAGCGDCGHRTVSLPPPFPKIEDDFDWMVRDYDSFRLFMMEELAHRFPERKRWTPGDMEVVLVELLAAQLDRLSHTLDVVHTERFLATAMRPQSVRRHLTMIGYDAHARTPQSTLERLPPLPDEETETKEQAIERLWALYPQEMERARAEGPRQINEQRRMVTLADHADSLMRHPLVEQAQARLVWTGGWNTILVSVLLDAARRLDTSHDVRPFPTELWSELEAFHRREGLPLPALSPDITARIVLRHVLERRRMIGSEVFLENATRVPITFSLSIRARSGYFRSELKDSLQDAFSADAGGMMEPGRFAFSEDVYASDIVETAMAVEGVETACLNRFKRVGQDYADQTDNGVIVIGDDEVAICLNQPGAPDQGSFDLTIMGGEQG